ncbi:SDR family oxidoreductase [Amycolatopsis sp. GM8]|uniref:SDR family oxidoreductase n=1 Tax=Amycolatopsis sp. GM8 TaxID=2896530 RepID=UPI001F189A6D|nr:SDR family oxidoreductase [Amycolatopsis sp. GM8]
MLLRDKVVVVSGIGSGLGRAIALQCARAGADVVLAARTEARLTEVTKEIAELGRRAVAVPTDVTDEDAAAALVSSTVDAFGRVDAVVNNAFAMPPISELTKVDLDPVRESFETNVYAAIRLARLFAGELEKTRGSAVMINSAVLRHSRRGFGPYKMTKASLLAATQVLSTELGPRGIRVNSVAPGYIWGDNLKFYFAYLARKRDITPEQVYEETAATIDLRKLPEPDEIADAVVFLLSDLARAITGHCLDVNCGEYHT